MPSIGVTGDQSWLNGAKDMEFGSLRIVSMKDSGRREAEEADRCGREVLQAVGPGWVSVLCQADAQDGQGRQTWSDGRVYEGMGCCFPAVWNSVPLYLLLVNRST